MAVTLTAAQRAAVEAEVTRYAPGAPADLQAIATNLVVQHLEEIDTTTQSVSFGDQSKTAWPPGMVARLLSASGATTLLASHRRPRARAIEAAS